MLLSGAAFYGLLALGEAAAHGALTALLTLPVDDALVPEYDKALMLYESLHQAILRGDVLSAHTVGRGGIAAAVFFGYLAAVLFKPKMKS